MSICLLWTNCAAAATVLCAVQRLVEQHMFGRISAK
jgi:hypothetical protein